MKNNLIGISGKIGSGKDAVGKILQYLYWLKDNKHSQKLYSYTHFLNGDYLNTNPNFEIKKFADKLKEIVCLLIGCTREQLEDREFKEKELGEEWWYWESYSDFKGAGRIDLELLPYTGNEELYPAEPIKLTPRKLLQILGTDCGREIIHPNIWVNALFADYTKHQRYERGTEIVGLTDGETVVNYEIPSIEYDFPNWIITDVRFPNEAQAIKDKGGIVIRVNRFKIITKTLPDGTECSFIPNPLFDGEEHPSETALDDYEFDHVIDNNGSLEELIEKVKQLNLV